MRVVGKNLSLALGAFLALGISSCGALPTGTGSFDRNLSVNGLVHLEFTNGSGNTRIISGSSGEVRIHAEFKVRAWPWESVRDRVADIVQHPPIAQDGHLIRIGGGLTRHTNLTVDYTIAVPVETRLRGVTGSGNLEVHGISGSVNLTAGSGNISAEGIGEDLQALTGSGGIHLAHIHGDVQATAGSGDISLSIIHGEIRAHTGSGDITIAHPERGVTAGAGSGDINIAGASADLRLRTGSGDLSIDGNPAPNSYWEFHTGSGDVAIHVPADANFHLYARSSSGSIETSIPIIVEEKTSRHELRARVGQGPSQSRVEVETSSGGITLR